MLKRGIWLVLAVPVVVVSSGARNAPAQTLIQGRTAFDNANAAGARAPGNLVSAGLARAQDAAAQGRSVHEITETPSTTPGPQRGFLISAATIISEQVNQLVLFLTDRFLARAGFDTSLAAGLLAAGSGTLGDLLDSLGTDGQAGAADNVDAGDTDQGADDGGRGGRQGRDSGRKVRRY